MFSQEIILEELNHALRGDAFNLDEDTDLATTLPAW